MVTLPPAIVIVIPLVSNAVTQHKVLAVAKIVCLILAYSLPSAFEMLTPMFDIRLQGGVLRIACHPKFAARPFSLATGADPKIAKQKSAY